MAYMAGQKLRASDLSTPTVFNGDATSRTTTSTSYTTTLTAANICGVAFTAPPSGKVLISWASGVSNSSSPNTANCSPAIRTGSTVGSGTVFLAASDIQCIAAVAFIRAGASHFVSGLTAGVVYNVALEQRVSGGTGTFVNRSVTVIPQLS